MKSRRPARRSRSVLARVAGYAGTTLLVAAAIVVLLVPLLDDGKSGGTAGAQGSASPSPTSPGGPAGPGPGLPVAPTGPAPQQNGTGRPDPAGGGGGGPQIPGQGGDGGLTWCPEGTAHYRAAATGVDVVITVASSGAIRAELSLRGRSPESQQTTVTGGRPHTFRFKGVSPQLVERVKVTTVSVGVSMQTCYARAAA
ncbi:hypothetical protein [Spirillospora sp. NPDC048819]|uniref:hypothetical protein n=1 Tax=Spirillospora sp. NPDC048819 TaxID=3155268 RepID=UPI0033C5FB21